MKTGIHPDYTATTVKCSCGNTFETRSTVDGNLTVELCNECHPFFTGKQKLVDSGGRVERFNRRYGQRKGAAADAAATDVAATETAASDTAASDAAATETAASDTSAAD